MRTRCGKWETKSQVLITNLWLTSIENRPNIKIHLFTIKKLKKDKFRMKTVSKISRLKINCCKVPKHGGTLICHLFHTGIHGGSRVQILAEYSNTNLDLD